MKRYAAAIGGTIFLFGMFLSFLTFEPVIKEIIEAWEVAKGSILLVGTTIFGGMLFVWGMGWTLSDKERKKMNKYNELQSEKKKKSAELERKRKRLLRKHNLEPK
jgi:hypothetical protein